MGLELEDLVYEGEEHNGRHAGKRRVSVLLPSRVFFAALNDAGYGHGNKVTILPTDCQMIVH